MKIAYLGDKNSHTYNAGQEMFGSSNEFISFSRVRECIQACDAGLADRAIVPIENSVEGAVTETGDALAEIDVYIVGEIACGIAHCLVGYKDTNFKKVKTIYSHPQALSQCREFLDKNFPLAERIARSSTSDALMQIKSNKALAIARSCDGYEDLNVLQSNVQDYYNNTTRFVAVSKEPIYSGEKCSVVISVGNKSGLLLKALQVFADNNLNMTKIESRPSKRKLGEYIFYIDFMFNKSKAELDNFFKKLSVATSYIKFLGLYSKSDQK